MSIPVSTEVEWRTSKPRVPGSNPGWGNFFFLLFLLKIYSEDYENEKKNIFLRKKIITFLKKLKTEDFFEDRKIRSSKLIFGQICRIYKDNLHWWSSKGGFKNYQKYCRICIENMFKRALIQVSFLQFFCCVLFRIHFFSVGSFSVWKLQ